MKTSPVNTTVFKGVPVANVKVKGVNSSYKLYEVGNKDADFLEKMYQSLDLKKLMPNMQDIQYTLWDEVIKNAINASKSRSKKVLLETCDNKPCGIMSYENKFNQHYQLNYIATFPVKSNNKVPFSGQILINELFKRLMNDKVSRIELTALRYSPFNPIAKYISLGFKMRGGTFYAERMNIDKNQVSQTLSKQEELFSFKKIKNPKEIDLNKAVTLTHLSKI